MKENKVIHNFFNVVENLQILLKSVLRVVISRERKTREQSNTASSIVYSISSMAGDDLRTRASTRTRQQEYWQ